MSTPERMPTEHDAALIVQVAMGAAPAQIARFTTGNHHFVYDIALIDGRVDCPPRSFS